MITIVGADWCPACNRAKDLAKEHGLAYNYVHIAEGDVGWDMVEILSGKRSIPQIFYHVGGSSEFKKALNNLGELSSEKL